MSEYTNKPDHFETPKGNTHDGERTRRPTMTLERDKAIREIERIEDELKARGIDDLRARLTEARAAIVEEELERVIGEAREERQDGGGHNG